MEFTDYHDDGTFAPDLQRNGQGWIILPDDVAWRKSLFPLGVMKHLAKLHMHLVQSMYRYVSQPGDVLLDPMGGTGTLMMAALEGRNVVTMDIEPGYHELQKEVYQRLLTTHIEMAGCVQLLGNCKVLLPFPCKHIIFSPPYGKAFKPSKTLTGIVADKYRVSEEEFTRYAETQGNVGMHNTFLYNRDMEKAYKLCLESLPIGGTLTIVPKDIIEKGERTYFTNWIRRICEGKLGMTHIAWYKTLMLGGPWQDMRRSKGEETVDDEDTMIFRRDK